MVISSEAIATIVM